MEKSFSIFMNWKLLIIILNEMSANGTHLEFRKHNVFSFRVDNDMQYEYFLNDKDSFFANNDVELIKSDTTFMIRFLLPSICRKEIAKDSVKNFALPRQTNIDSGHRFLIIS